MGEKKEIKVSLGTVVCLVIIVILIFVIAGMWYYYNVINKPTNTATTNINLNTNAIAQTNFNNSTTTTNTTSNTISNNSDTPYFTDINQLPTSSDNTVIKTLIIDAGFKNFNGGYSEIYKSNNKTIGIGGEKFDDTTYIWTISYNNKTILEYRDLSNSEEGTPNDYIIYVLENYIILVTRNEAGAYLHSFAIFDLNGNKVLEENQYDTIVPTYFYNSNTDNYSNMTDPLLIYKNHIYFVLLQIDNNTYSSDGYGLYYINLTKSNLNIEKICNIPESVIP